MLLLTSAVYDFHEAFQLLLACWQETGNHLHDTVYLQVGLEAQCTSANF